MVVSWHHWQCNLTQGIAPYYRCWCVYVFIYYLWVGVVCLYLIIHHLAKRNMYTHKNVKQQRRGAKIMTDYRGCIGRVHRIFGIDILHDIGSRKQ